MARSLVKILGYEFVDTEIIGKVLMEGQSAFGDAILPVWRVKRGVGKNWTVYSFQKKIMMTNVKSARIK
jgi:hypothetical protein